MEGRGSVLIPSLEVRGRPFEFQLSVAARSQPLSTKATKNVGNRAAWHPPGWTAESRFV